MCGIAGMVEREAGGPDREAELRGMLDRIAHRGPDGSGILFDGPAGLGHRRLAVIDLSERAAQPMRLRCAGGSPPIWIVFNGEIYDYRELREELEGRGHAFHSASDTETVLHLYEEEGEGCLARLRGMFALAIWDGRAGRLLLARDPVGKKPLYYRMEGGRFLFASESKAIAFAARVRGAPLEADPASLRSYLALKYVPGPATAWRGVMRLPPGHLLSLEDGRIRLAPFWALPSFPDEPPARPAAAIESLAHTVGEAVRLRMRSDVPLGLFLSGGLDSAIVAAEMSRAAAAAGGAAIRTFTVGFREEDYDETARAARVASALGTLHEEIRIEPAPSLVTEALPRIAWHLDQPFGDTSALAVWHLARRVRERVTVALSGDGGDEIFLGYDRYRAHRLAERLPRGAAGLLGSLARLIPGRPSRRNLAGRAARFLESAHRPPVERNDAWIRLLPAGLADALLAQEFLAAAGAAGDPLGPLHAAGLPASASADPLDPIRRADLLVWLPDDVLHKVDAMTMAHGLEARAPLLDVRVVEAALRFPAASHLPRRGGHGKRILRAAFRGRLPAGAGSGPKAGFGLPLDHWLRGDLAGWCRELLLQRRTLERGIVRREGVERLLHEHRSGLANREEAIWSLVMLEQWFRSMVEARQEVAA